MRRLGVLVMIGAVAWAGCGGSDGPSDAEKLAYVLTLACVSDRATTEVGIEAYLADNGERPSTTADVIPDYLRHAPTYWKIEDGKAVRVNTSKLSTADCNARTKIPKRPT